MMKPHCFAGFYHLFICHAFFGINDIFTNGSFKQPCILKHHAELTAQILSFHILRWCSVNQYISGICLIKTHQQINHCCFSRSGRSDNRNFLPCFRLYRKIFYNHFVFIISKLNVFEFHIAFYIGKRFCLMTFIFHFLFSKKFKYTFTGCRCGLQTGCRLGKL